MSATVTVREVMNREYLGVSESDDLVETVELMCREGADAAVVLRGATPVGILTDRDVLTVLVDGPPIDAATVADAIRSTVPTVRPDERLAAAIDRVYGRSARRLVVTSEAGEPAGVVTDRDLLAASATDPGRVADRDRPDSGTVETGVASALATEVETDAEDGFREQSICEVCGRLAQELSSFNGQLLCEDCRGV